MVWVGGIEPIIVGASPPQEWVGNECAARIVVDRMPRREVNLSLGTGRPPGPAAEVALGRRVGVDSGLGPQPRHGGQRPGER